MAKEVDAYSNPPRTGSPPMPNNANLAIKRQIIPATISSERRRDREPKNVSTTRLVARNGKIGEDDVL
jgi:hypothetical protein